MPKVMPFEKAPLLPSAVSYDWPYVGPSTSSSSKHHLSRLGFIENYWQVTATFTIAIGLPTFIHSRTFPCRDQYPFCISQ